MQYHLYRQGKMFCIGIKFPVKCDGVKDALYWNPEKKSFEDNALHCWRDYKDEDRIVAEFTRLIIFQDRK